MAPIRTSSKGLCRLLLIAILLVSFSLLSFQQVRSAFLKNTRMSWALKYLTSDDFVLGEDELQSIFDVLNEQSETTASQFSAQKELLGSLCWDIGDETSARQYWIEGGITSDFFIGKVKDLTQRVSLDYIDRAIFLSPSRSELLYYKGLYFEANGDSESAKHWYEMARIQDQWVDLALAFDVLYKRGDWLFQQQQSAEAEEVLLMAVKIADTVKVDDVRNLAMAYRWLGLLYQQQGDIQTARSHFIKAVELSPEDFWNYLSLGLVAEAEKQSPEIVFRYFDQARIVAPSAIYAYIYPAQHYLGLNQRDQWQYFCEQTPRYLQKEQQWLDICRPVQ